jgi:2-polyprenyl-3-methyl-5-hydroxy-6-metoxy-1,4-benzoquinol methylase
VRSLVKKADPKGYWDGYARKFDAIYSHRKSRVGNILDKIFRRDMYQRFEFSMTESEPVASRTFLDVGCGTGWYSLELAKRGAKKVVGIDLSTRMLKIAKERLEEKDVVDFLEADFMEYEPGEAFNVVIAIGLMDYLEDPPPALKKMRAWTNDKCILSFPRARTARTMLRKVRLRLKGCPVYFYSQETIDRLLKEAGFKDYKIETIGQLYCVSAIV